MKSQSKIIARYAETDQMGIVHHSVYPVWFEVARTDFIKKAGMTYTQMEQSGIMLPLAELTCRYFRPAFYEDELTVEASILRLTPARIEFLYEVYNQSGELLTRGTTMHGWTDHSLHPINLRKEHPDIWALVVSTTEPKQQESKE
jgi:acyl-CoA thioester hydrolase